MNIVWLLLKIVVYTNVLIGIYRLSKILFFELIEKPIIWIIAACVIGISNMIVANIFQWDSRLVITAAILSILFNFALTPSKRSTKGEMGTELDKANQGMSRVRIQSKLGLIGYGLFSLIGYILFFGEQCDRNGDCVSFINLLLQ